MKTSEVKARWIVTAQRVDSGFVYIEIVKNDGKFFSDVVTNKVYRQFKADEKAYLAGYRYAHEIFSFKFVDGVYDDSEV